MQICSMIYNMFRQFILVRQFISVSMVGFAYLLPQGILCGYGYFLLISSWYMWLHRNALGSNYGLPDVSSSLTFTDIYMCMFSLGGVVEDFGVTDCWFCVVLWPTYRPIANKYNVLCRPSNPSDILTPCHVQAWRDHLRWLTFTEY